MRPIAGYDDNVVVNKKEFEQLQAENKEKQELIDQLCSQEPCPNCDYGVTGACYGCVIKQLQAENKRLLEETASLGKE